MKKKRVWLLMEPVLMVAMATVTVHLRHEQPLLVNYEHVRQLTVRLHLFFYLVIDIVFCFLFLRINNQPEVNRAGAREEGRKEREGNLPVT